MKLPLPPIRACLSNRCASGDRACPTPSLCVVQCSVVSTRLAQLALLGHHQRQDRIAAGQRNLGELLLRSGVVEGPFRRARPVVRLLPSLAATVRAYFNRFRPTL